MTAREVFGLGERDCSGVDVAARAFNPSAFVDCQAHAGDVEAADLRARRFDAADAQVICLDIRDILARDDADIGCRESVNVRGGRDNCARLQVGG